MLRRFHFTSKYIQHNINHILACELTTSRKYGQKYKYHIFSASILALQDKHVGDDFFQLYGMRYGFLRYLRESLMFFIVSMKFTCSGLSCSMRFCQKQRVYSALKMTVSFNKISIDPDRAHLNDLINLKPSFENVPQVQYKFDRAQK